MNDATMPVRHVAPTYDSPRRPPSSTLGDASHPRSLLFNQFDLVWKFAEEYVLRDIDEAVALWEPSRNVVSVRHHAHGWVADWPDETRTPIPNATAGWILWHIEWWWADTIERVTGGTPIPPETHLWTGSVEGIWRARQAWVRVLCTADLDQRIDTMAAERQTLTEIAAWVNVELMKNLAEINQLALLRANLDAHE